MNGTLKGVEVSIYTAIGLISYVFNRFTLYGFGYSAEDQLPSLEYRESLTVRAAQKSNGALKRELLCMRSNTGKVDRLQIAKDWRARGFSCGLWVDPPGQVWEDFVHSTDELLMLMEGALELEMQDKTFHLAIGEEVLIPAHTNHTVRNTGGTTARWLYGYKS